MKMRIAKLNGDLIDKKLPDEFIPFRSGFAGQDEKHAEKLETWIETNLSLKVSYRGFADGVACFAEKK